MIEATVTLHGISEYGQSAPIRSEKKPKEGHKEFETRTWRERMHVNKAGEVVIPAMALKNCIAEAAKFLGVRIPGKGISTYTKHFEAGVLVTESPSLGIKADKVDGIDYFVPSDGRRGGGKRVWKTFPIIPDWKTKVTFVILDHTITQDVFEQHIRQAGNFIGIGWFRPRNNGIFGRFAVDSIEWDVITEG